ncbi:MAG: UMP kinase [Planctomycetes bacterium]|nr:UMP kinase [Planctomycetota bacterium]MCH7601854.1 UMP kinase [Planctomycetota bacterium]
MDEQATKHEPQASNRQFQRVVLKISGESFTKSGQSGIDPEELSVISHEIADAASCGTQLAVVVGGGNIVRGASLAKSGQIAQASADYMGMLGTIINGVALKEALDGMGQPARLMSAIDIPAIAESWIRGRALRHLEKGRVLILAAGTGNPFFTTDTCASLRGAELNADILLKATKVDGVYDSDPETNSDAVRYETLRFTDAIKQQLGVMDLTAMTMCMERNLPVNIFAFKVKGNIRRVVQGERIGTLLTN